MCAKILMVVKHVFCAIIGICAFEDIFFFGLNCVCEEGSTFGEYLSL